jgi:inosine-uridine nucleoside N-ribohydrolase
VLVDSDAGLDDLRAIAVLAPHRRIAAVVVTEGLATPRGGARALRAYLRGTGIPVVEGASPAPGRDLDPDRVRGLDGWRATVETLNGTLPPPGPADRAGEAIAPPVEAEVERLTTGCSRLALLAIGPWTSFQRYEGAVGGRLVHVVAQGSPFPDDEARGEPDG